MQQQIVCQKCRCPNKFGTVFCRNCGTKLKVQDLRHPDRAGVVKIKTAFARLFKLLVILAVVAGLAALFLPFGMAKYPTVTGEDEVARVKKICEDIDKSLAKERKGLMVSFSPAELAYAVNHLLDPKRPPVKVDAAGAAGTVRPLGSGGTAGLGGDASLGGGGGLGQRTDLSRSVDGTPQTTCPSSAPNANKRKSSAKDKKEIDRLTVNFTFDVTEKLDLKIVMTGMMLEVFPYRFEIVGTPGTKREEGDGPMAKTELTFDVKNAKYGHLPLPMMIKEHVIALFRGIAFSKNNVESYLKCVRGINIKSEDHIEIILGK